MIQLVLLEESTYSVTMSSTRATLLHSIKNLLAEAEKLPDDIFEDHLQRQSLQYQLTRLKNQASTPLERVFGEICFQVVPQNLPDQSIYRSDDRTSPTRLRL